jgi:hypothetical protein
LIANTEYPAAAKAPTHPVGLDPHQYLLGAGVLASELGDQLVQPG